MTNDQVLGELADVLEITHRILRRHGQRLSVVEAAVKAQPDEGDDDLAKRLAGLTDKLIDACRVRPGDLKDEPGDS